MTDNITGKIVAHSRSDATRPSRSRGSRCWALRSVIRQSPLEGRKVRQAQTRFFKTAVDQYAAEMSRLMKISTDAMQQSLASNGH